MGQEKEPIKIILWEDYNKFYRTKDTFLTNGKLKNNKIVFSDDFRTLCRVSPVKSDFSKE